MDDRTGTLRSGAYTCTPAETEARAASRQCRAQVKAVLHPAHGTTAVASIGALADRLASRPLDTQVSADYTRLSVLARHTRFNGGWITSPAFAETLRALERRHQPNVP
jgi:hypothetical protein